MSDSQFEILLGRLLDDSLSNDGFSELVELVKSYPERQTELQTQLEAAELIAQAEDDLRGSALFVAATQTRIEVAPMEEHVRSVMNENSAHENFVATGIIDAPLNRFRNWQWVTVVIILLAILGGGIFFAQNQPSSVEPEKTIARISALNGSVQWTGDGGQVKRELAVGQELRGGMLESLSADSSAEIEFHDGTTVAIFGQSALTIAEHRQKEIHLRHGGLSAQVAPQPEGQPMRIHTPTAEIEVLGTQLNVDVEPAFTMLTVNEGKVRIKRLVDGSIADVSADQQIVASTKLLAKFNATPRRESVSVWRSNLPEGKTFGRWLPKQNGLRATPLLWRSCKHKNQKPALLFVAALRVYHGDPSVALHEGGKIRIRGKMKDSSPTVLSIGMTAKHPRGGFAGKYILRRKTKTFLQADGSFDLELNVKDFVPEEPDYVKSPIGLEVYDWWCYTYKVDADLSISSVEFISTMNPANTKP